MPDEQRTATRDSGETWALPTEREEIGFRESYDTSELERIRRGVVPRNMDDKWLIFFEQPWLYAHRRTGVCVYAVRFERGSVVESWANRNPEQYRETDAEYDRAFLKWLIDELLLGKDATFPMPPDLALESEAPGADRAPGDRASVRSAWSFICPTCNAPTLETTDVVEIGPDRYSDENTLQLLACNNCGLTGAAQYSESRRGAGESWRHTGYVLAAEDVEKIRARLPEARQWSKDGEWRGVEQIATPLSTFPIRLETSRESANGDGDSRGSFQSIRYGGLGIFAVGALGMLNGWFGGLGSFLFGVMLLSGLAWALLPVLFPRLSRGPYRVEVRESNGSMSVETFLSLSEARSYADDAASEEEGPNARIFDRNGNLVGRGAHYASSRI